MKHVILRVFVAVAVAGGLLFASFGTSLAGRGGGPGQGDESGRGETHSPEVILVKFRAGTSAQDQDRVHQRRGGAAVEEISGIGVQVVRVPRGNKDDQEHEGRKAREYSQEAEVEFAEPDGAVRALFTPNDPRFGEQWALSKIQAPEAWDIAAQDGSGVKVAILDTGIDRDHEDVSSKVVASKNFTTSRTLDDKYGHGTHVAGVVAASTDNGKGVAGVALNAQLLNGKVLRDDGFGYWSWVAKGITWSSDNGAKVINMSLGGDTSSSTLAQAVNYAWSKGVVLVAAAGNQSSDTVLYPAAYTNVIAVAGTDTQDHKSDFSNYGVGVDIAAPGGIWGLNYEWLRTDVGILSTMPNHSNYFYRTYGVPLTYGPLSGTSMATPHVTGVVALLFAEHPDWTNTQVRQRLESSADPLADPLLGGLRGIGRLNALKAVRGW